MAGKKRVTQAAADELVKRYIIDKVKAQAKVDQELFDSVLSLHELAEQRESSHDSAKRLGELRDSPMIRAAMAVLGDRFKRLADIGVRIATDTLALRVQLRARLEAEGIDPTDPKQHDAAEAEYERVLAATIPLETALENVSGLADMVDLANDVLNQTGLKRHAYEAAWQVGRRIIFKDPKVLAKMEHVKTELQGDRARLDRVTKLIRKEGPGIVREAYRRAAKAAASRGETAGAKGHAKPDAAKAAPAKSSHAKPAPAKPAARAHAAKPVASKLAAKKKTSRS